ncbi:HAD family hydrolase [Bacillus sp. FJAT-50079]|uniref:HAD family hydrolase n=1 Tax=Bacillus sp. FJAT-50079 TaxID=2833577 RepID=UPI001BC926F9|nr:HAD family hydrolase [Bacillus sp. FJAT-50079]MBS4209309.1 HAD family hydrolase [Bacillus sp. FJAT-50079]
MIKTVLFDVDGVLLSEERYFDMSALTVWEVLYSDKYVGLAPEKFKTVLSDDEITAIRAEIFQNDQVFKLMKSGGINSNWDMIYLTATYQLIRLLEQVKDIEKEKIITWVSNEIDRSVLLEMAEVLATKDVTLDFSAFLTDFSKAEQSKAGLFAHLDQLAKEKLEVEATVFGQIGELWATYELIAQEWYVGDKHVIASTGRSSVQSGKKGFLSDEKTLRSPEEISELFQALKRAGITIGIGTGRPKLETIEPFKHLGWLEHFDVNYIVTADDVLAAEAELKEGPSLSKPHPYTYILGLSGKTKSVEQCLAEKLPIANGNELLIVGDSLADLLAAREMGAVFAAVLTGLSGKDARAEFEEYQAEYIFDDVSAIKEFVLSLVEK